MSKEHRTGVGNAEYYFEYAIEQVSGDFEIDTPKLYFEWDSTNRRHTLFAVPTEWLGKQDTVDNIKDKSDSGVVRRELDTLPYDEVVSVFDIRGTECAPLADEASRERAAAEVKKTVSFENFYSDGCRLIIESRNAFEHSGVGILEYKKAGEIVATFFLGINFTMKKRIEYWLRVNGSELKVKFRSHDRPKDIRVRVARDAGRLPCLNNDMRNDSDPQIALDFSQGSKYSHKMMLPGGPVTREERLSLGFVDPEDAKFYILECVENNTIPEAKRFYLDIGEAQNSCPYCHRTISEGLETNSGYRKDGGISCQGKVGEPKIYNKRGVPLKKTVYCEDDIIEGHFKPDFSRLLPMSFLSRKNFKVAFTGSARAGKTTYISRFFGITGSKTAASMPMPMISAAMKEVGVKAKTAHIPAVISTEGKYCTGDMDWTTNTTHYIDREITLIPPEYPKSTPQSDQYIYYPFTVDVDGRGYVSFYDVAGEDAQTKSVLNAVSNGNFIGVFCIINGKKDEEGNNKILKTLKDSNIPRNSPIAFIVTKMDMLESEFDPNSYCLRNDYFDGDRVYEGSYLERVVDQSSEEILSYLKSQDGMAPNTEDFTNVKYFGISSFNFRDSIHDELADIDSPGELKFNCSAKRMELPFIWMLKQFGLIR